MKYSYLILFFFLWYKQVISASYTEKIRIKIDNEPSQNKVHLDVVKSAIIFFENLLKMKIPDDDNTQITYSTFKCTKCDILLLIDITDNTACTNGMPFTEILQNTAQGKVGKIKFCDLPKYPINEKLNEANNFAFKKMVDSVIHGIMKLIALNGTGNVQYKTVQCNTTKQCSSTDYQNLLSKFKEFYGQTQLQNMPVTQYDPPTPTYVLWDKQYAFEDIMTDNYAKENKYWSAFNNQILKDMGLFSTVNDKMVQQITIPQSESCTQKNNLFCQNTETSLGCNASLTSKSKCNLIESGGDCRVYQAVDKGHCLDPQLNVDLADEIKLSGTYERYDWNSRCFLSDIQDISSTKYSPPVRCYKYSCDDNNNVKIYLDTSTNGNKEDVDVVTCTVEMQGLQKSHKNYKYYSDTGLTCPTDNAQFCKSLPKECKNFCSQKGVCVSGKCKCVENYYGDDCSCFQQHQENGVCVSSCSKKMKLPNDGSNICELKCPLQQYFDEGQCKQCSSKCKTCWKSDESCDSCNEGYILYPDSTNNDNSYTCKSTYPDKPCDKNKYYNGSSCVPCDSDCQSCVVKEDFCTSCLSNQYLENNGCKDCPKNCLACTRFQKCTKCSENTFLSKLLNECLDKCETNQFGYLNTCVDICPKGYFGNSSSGLCEKCDSTCMACQNTSTYCTECEYYRKLNNNLCQDQCESNQVYVRKDQGADNWIFHCVSCSIQDKCEQCLGNPSYCTKCLSTFYLYQSKCLQECPNRNYSDEDKRECIQCDDNCLTCFESSKKCTSCESGLYLKSDTCVASCGDGYVANSDTKKCDVQNKTSDETKPSSEFSSIIKFYNLTCVIVLFLSLLY